MFMKASLSLAGLAGLAHAGVGRALVARDSNPYGPTAQCPNGYEVVEHQISELSYPVIINQFFDHNTIIDINGNGNVINITNAPVQVSTTVTVTTTTTSTVSA